MRSIIALVFFVLAGGLATSQQDASTSKTEKLTMADLVARPELWPEFCHFAVPQNLGGKQIPTTQDIVVLAVLDTGVVIGVPGTRGSLIDAEKTDVLERANAEYAVRSEKQRAVDLEFLNARPDLWPDEVTFRFGADFEGASFEAGDKIAVGRLRGKELRVRHPKKEGYLPLELGMTDFLAQVRAKVENPPKKARHPLLAEWQGKLVKMPMGSKKKARKHKIDPSKSPDYVLLYYSAGWCGPCRSFTPDLAEFYKKNKRHVGKRFEIVWVSRDKTEAEMFAYAKKAKMPWPAIEWSALKNCPRTESLRGGGIPGLVMLDSHGAVVLHSAEMKDGSARKVMVELMDLLKQKKKRR